MYIREYMYLIIQLHWAEYYKYISLYINYSGHGCKIFDIYYILCYLLLLNMCMDVILMNEIED